MKDTRLSIAWLMLAGFVLLGVACGGSEGAPAGDVAAIEAEVPPVEQQAEAASANDKSGALRPDWHTVEFTDVRSGESFTIADFEGKVVIIEAMAVWCPACDQQQLQIRDALNVLGEDAVGVSLDVDPNENADLLSAHASELGWDWYFALAGPDVAVMLQELYGPQILTPPATPVVIVAPDGTAQLTPFGPKHATELTAAIEPLLQ